MGYFPHRFSFWKVIDRNGQWENGNPLCWIILFILFDYGPRSCFDGTLFNDKIPWGITIITVFVVIIVSPLPPPSSLFRATAVDHYLFLSIIWVLILNVSKFRFSTKATIAAFFAREECAPLPSPDGSPLTYLLPPPFTTVPSSTPPPPARPLRGDTAVDHELAATSAVRHSGGLVHSVPLGVERHIAPVQAPTVTHADSYRLKQSVGVFLNRFFLWPYVSSSLRLSYSLTLQSPNPLSLRLGPRLHNSPFDFPTQTDLHILQFFESLIRSATRLCFVGEVLARWCLLPSSPLEPHRAPWPGSDQKFKCQLKVNWTPSSWRRLQGYHKSFVTTHISWRQANSAAP